MAAMMMVSAVLKFSLLSLCLFHGRLVAAQEGDSCESAIAIAESNFSMPLLGSTVNQTATNDGCLDSALNVSKQWYTFEFNADLRGYYTWLSCPTDDSPAAPLENAIQQVCGSGLCRPKLGDHIVDPNDLMIEECSAVPELTTSHSMTWTGINNLTYNAFVAYGEDQDNTTGNFITTLIQHQGPDNEFCVNAIPLERNGPAVQGSLYNALPYLFSLPDSTPVCNSQSKISVWYSFVGHGVYKAVIRTCPTDDMDAKPWMHTIDVQENCGDSRCACITCQVVPNPECPNGGRQLTLSTVGARTYHIAVSTSELASPRGTFKIQVLTENMLTTPTPTSSPTMATASTAAPTAAPITAEPSTSAPMSSAPHHGGGAMMMIVAMIMFMAGVINFLGY